MYNARACIYDAGRSEKAKRKPNAKQIIHLISERCNDRVNEKLASRIVLASKRQLAVTSWIAEVRRSR